MHERRRTPDLRASLVLLSLLAGCDAAPLELDLFKDEPAVETGIPDRGFDVEHYALDLRLRPAERRIEGRTTVRFQATRALEVVELDLEGLLVQGIVDQEGHSLTFEQVGDRLDVKLNVPLGPGETEALTIAYGGTPVTGLWFVASGPEGDDPNQVFTQGFDDDSRGWFPCLDHPSDRATTEIRVTMPGSWRSVAPGDRVARTENGDGTVTEEWRMSFPHPPYLMSLVAGELDLVESEWDGIPLWVLAEPRFAGLLEASFSETDDALAFLSDYLGQRYPYSKYSQAVVANFPYGGMENISATTLTDLTLDDERGHRDEQSNGLVTHEAAHQWFGDLVTCRDWPHAWLNEGFATYLTLLYFEKTRGVDEFRARTRDALDSYLAQDARQRQAVVSSDYVEPADLFDTHIYDGAAVRLNLLRDVLGPDVFRAGLQTFLAEHQGTGVVTDDLRRTLEKVSGRDLRLFFEQWFLRPGHPEFEVSWDWDQKRSAVQVEVRQVQRSLDGTPEVFEMPVVIEILDEGGTVQHRVQIDDRREIFEFSVHGRPLYVRFDKHDVVPKTLRPRKKASEWIAIAHSDDDVNGRRDACRALGLLAREALPGNTTGHETYVAELVFRLQRDPSPWVRAAAARALGVAGGLEARERLQVAARQDAEARVRVAALEGLTGFGEHRELARFAREVYEEGFSWRTLGAAASLMASAAPRDAFGWILERIYQDRSPHDQLSGLLITQLGELEDSGVPEQLRRWARDEALHPNARAAAARALGHQHQGLVKNARALGELLDSESFRLRDAAVRALAEIDESVSRGILREYYPRARTSDERRVIEQVLGGHRI